mgnify:CR=1 FL=1
MPRLLIVDGHAYAYRAFYAIRDLRGPGGQPTNAIFGFVKMVTRLERVAQPTHRVVIWDGGLAAERLTALPEYKAQRPPMPPALQGQLDEIVAWLQAAAIPSWRRPGVEADDWIGALACRAAADGWSVVIASSDKDFMQLVSERIGLINPNDPSETVWTPEQVRDKTGVEPDQIVDWLSLVGDSVDNIPGVPGVGVKTAARLLRQFGSVDALYGRLADVEPARLRAALEQAAELVRRNRDLVRLRVAGPVEFEPSALAVRAADTAALRALYERWGFRSLAAALSPRPQVQGALFEGA